MGVHISFVRSTNLDQWTWIQLRTMKCGGNDAFQRDIPKSKYADAKTKYSSAEAARYRDKLQKLVADDERKYKI